MVAKYSFVTLGHLLMLSELITLGIIAIQYQHFYDSVRPGWIKGRYSPSNMNSFPGLMLATAVMTFLSAAITMVIGVMFFFCDKDNWKSFSAARRAKSSEIDSRAGSGGLDSGHEKDRRDDRDRHEDRARGKDPAAVLGSAGESVDPRRAGTASPPKSGRTASPRPGHHELFPEPGSPHLSVPCPSCPPPPFDKT